MARALRKEKSTVINMVQVAKNFLPSMFFKKLSDVVHGDNFQWFFNDSSMDNTQAPFVKDDDFLFTHTLFREECGRASSFFEMFEPILYSINEKRKVNQLIRMKLNLYTNQGKNITYFEHCDINDRENNNKPNKDNHTAVLNFTTCNGGTKINKKIYKSNENEILMFNNTTKHSGISQTDKKIRVALNINWR